MNEGVGSTPFVHSSGGLQLAHRILPIPAFRFCFCLFCRSPYPIRASNTSSIPLEMDDHNDGRIRG